MEEPNKTAEQPVAEKLNEVIESVAQHANKFYNLTREEMVAKLAELLETKPISDVKDQIDSLKQNFYRKLKIEMEAALNNEDEGNENAVLDIDALEVKFKELLAKYRELKAAENAATEAEQEKNLAEKLRILDELEHLTTSTDDLTEVLNAFHKLQQEWKAIGQVPAQKVTELWKAYSAYLEKFYDLQRISNDLRDYDFKKNLEAKTALCEQAEKLSSDEIPAVDAFKQLQKLHEEWREIGPVARELREQIWNRFKTASTAVNKRHQAYFESIKEQEEKFVAEKDALCEQIEKIDLEALKTIKQWEEKTKEVIDIQNRWKAIGGVPSYKAAVKAFRRFRAACDNYFNAKKAFYKNVKGEWAKNFEAKKALCEQAEALKDSTEWKETAEKFVALQKEWKKLGPTARKQSDAIWKRFVTACDYFFEQKAANFSDKYSEEIANLKAKKAIIEKIVNYAATGDTKQDADALNAMIEEYGKIGFVPFREKDKLAKAFRAAMDKHAELLKGHRDGKPSNERAKLLKEYDRLKSELATYENNIGFFNQKTAGAMAELMNKKIEKLRAQYDKVVEQIKALDQE
jgi:hypothetical protein